MRYDLINFRLSQVLMTTPYLNMAILALMAQLPESWLKRISSKQLASVWCPNLGPEAVVQRNGDIEDINSLNKLEGGHWLTPKSISYLNDRLGLMKQLKFFLKLQIF